MDDLTPLIPSAWLAAAHEWAPWALGALVLATIAVRLLLPLARAVERWAITTPAAWDDAPSRRVVVALEWAAGASAAILALIPRLTIGDPSRRAQAVRPPSDAAPLAAVPQIARYRAIGCVICGKEAALVGEEIPADGLCRWCRDEGRTLGGRAALAIGLAIVVGASALTSGCSGAAQQHRGLNTLTTIADPTYGEAVDLCDRLRDRIIERTGTTYDEDRADMDAVHEVCDPMVAGFEALRSSQLTARAAIDSGIEGAIAAAIHEGLRLWPIAQQLVDRIREGSR